jgi:hypothetical protein
MAEAASGAAGGGAPGGGGGGCGGGADRFLPVANIARIMKKALPSNAKIAKDAKEAVQECVSEFVSFVTSELSPFCFPFVAASSPVRCRTSERRRRRPPGPPVSLS